MEFKELWDLESAMKVLTNETADSKLWAEAVEWLMLYGPPEIQQILVDASAKATSAAFPELQPRSYAADGQPYYDIVNLAESLGISEKEAKQILQKKTSEHPLQALLNDIDDGDETVH